MADRNVTLTSDEACAGPFKNALCVDVDRVYDSCADKDCLEDLVVIFSPENQAIVDNCCSLRAKSCKILTTYVNVEEVAYNQGCYAVCCDYYFMVCIDTYQSNSNVPVTVQGLCTFCKRCLLYGSTGSVRVFTSEACCCDDYDDILPTSLEEPVAKVQAVDPMVLSCRSVACQNTACMPIPAAVNEAMGGNLAQGIGTKTVLVTLGLFSIIQLERAVQVTVPAYNFCIPEKECSCETENPCDMFRSVDFPLSEFFPTGSAGCNECGCDRPMNYGGSCETEEPQRKRQR